MHRIQGISNENIPLYKLYQLHLWTNTKHNTLLTLTKGRKDVVFVCNLKHFIHGNFMNYTMTTQWSSPFDENGSHSKKKWFWRISLIFLRLKLLKLLQKFFHQIDDKWKVLQCCRWIAHTMGVCLCFFWYVQRWQCQHCISHWVKVNNANNSTHLIQNATT